MNAWESPGSGEQAIRGKSEVAVAEQVQDSYLLPTSDHGYRAPIRRWNDGRDVGNLGEVVWHYQRHDRRPMGHSERIQGSKEAVRECVWRVFGARLAL